MIPDSIDYQRMVQDALLQVVQRSLALVAEHGMPGAHHFYIAFATGVPGVVMPDELRRKYPDQITVVLQHDFKDLEVLDESFAVTLRFGGIPQRLTVPYAALVSFYDPSVQFALRFEPANEADESEGDAGAAEEQGVDEDRPRRPPVRAVLAAADRLAAAKEEHERRRDEAASEAGDAAEAAESIAAAEASDESDDGEEPQGAEIVSFDAFRRR